MIEMIEAWWRRSIYAVICGTWIQINAVRANTVVVTSAQVVDAESLTDLFDLSLLLLSREHDNR